MVLAPADALARGRAAFERRAWAAAQRELAAAADTAPLGAVDLERLALATHLLGLQGEATALLARVHQQYLAEGDVPRAARAAIWLGFHSQIRGEAARSSGWVTRARLLLDAHPSECVEHGYLRLPDALRAFQMGDPERAFTLFREATALGERFAERDLTTLGRLGQGRSLLRLGRIPQGVSLVDEAMVSVMSDEVSPSVAGDVYCSAIDAFNEVFDLARCQEWTTALFEWCAAQPDLVPYRGSCLIHRAEILQRQGAWPDAVEAAEQAREGLSHAPGQPSIAGAYYRLAELWRVRGRFEEAEEAYRMAAQHGRQPEPGRALLRLAEGQGEAAAGAIRRMLDEAQAPRIRPLMLSAAVEILLATHDLPAARAAAEELGGIAKQYDATYLDGLARQAEGAVMLAEGDARKALPLLRGAWELWCRMEMPYEAARARVMVGIACGLLDDPGTAELEFDAAARVFSALGAAPDLERLRHLVAPAMPATAGGLSAREVEVLTLVASGKTNRAIAQSLRISEKTVARHVSNIFVKLGISNRAAATAYAYEHQLVHRTG